MPVTASRERQNLSKGGLADSPCGAALKREGTKQLRLVRGSTPYGQASNLVFADPNRTLLS